MLTEVDKAARIYAEKRGAVAGLMEALKRTLDDAQRAMLPGIQEAADAAATARAALKQAIIERAEEFQKPRTRTYHGVRVGLRTLPRGVSYGSDASVVHRIRERLPDRFESLVRVTERPVVAALAALPAAQRDLLGIKVVPGEEAVVIRPADGGLDKAVEALLSDAARIEAGGSG